jgi:hypothetical protein
LITYYFKDNTTQRKVTTKEGMTVAKDENFHFIETSAKTGKECKKAMHIILEGSLFLFYSLGFSSLVVFILFLTVGLLMRPRMYELKVLLVFKR